MFIIKRIGSFITTLLRAIGRSREPKGTMLSVTPTMASFSVPSATYHERRREEGFNYANQQLRVYGDAAVTKLNNDVDLSRMFDEYDSFDQGVEAAVRQYHERQKD